MLISFILLQSIIIFALWCNLRELRAELADRDNAISKFRREKARDRCELSDALYDAAKARDRGFEIRSYAIDLLVYVAETRLKSARMMEAIDHFRACVSKETGSPDLDAQLIFTKEDLLSAGISRGALATIWADD